MSTRRTFISQAGTALSLPLSLAARAATPALRMAYFETYSPLSFNEKSGVRGILVDVLDEVIGRRLQTLIEHTGYPWNRAQALVQRGEADGICTIATPERLSYAVAADEPVLSAPTCIFVRADSPLRARLAQVRSLEELRTLNPVVLSYAGNGWAKVKLTDFHVEWGSDFDSALKMLVLQRGDLMVENAVTMQHSLKRIPGGAAVIMLPNRMDQANFQLLLSRQSPHLGLLPAFNKAMAQFRSEPGYPALLQRYGVQL